MLQSRSSFVKICNNCRRGNRLVHQRVQSKVNNMVRNRFQVKRRMDLVVVVSDNIFRD